MRLNDTFEAHKDNIEFFLIYVREAHPADGWQTPQNLMEEVLYDAPTTDDERAENDPKARTAGWGAHVGDPP